MDGEIQILLIFDGQWGTDSILPTQQVTSIEPLKVRSTIGRNRPSLGVVRQGYLGQLVLNTILITFTMRQNIAEANTVVEHTELDIHLLSLSYSLLKRDSQLIIMIAHGVFLTPHLLPRLILRGGLLASHPDVITQQTTIELEPKMRGGNDHCLSATDRIIGFVVLHADRDRDDSIGRTDAHFFGNAAYPNATTR